MEFTVQRTVRPYLDSAEWERLTAECLQPFVFALRGDRELDGGSLTYYDETNNIYAPLAAYKITVDGVEWEWLGIEQCAQVTADLWKATVTMVEVSKIAEGVLLDGLAVTQPEDVSQRKNMLGQLQRLLRQAPGSQDYIPMFKLQISDSDIVQQLTETPCPEYKFNSQTTLWEALVAFGNNIGALPRVKFGSLSSGSMFVVDYHYVNIADNPVANLGGGDEVVGSGKMVEQEQYNSQLSMLAENVIEE